MLDKKTIFNSLIILLTLCLVNNTAFAITDSPKFRAEFIQLEDTQASNIDFFISKSDLTQDLSRNDALVKVIFDGSSLLREKTYPQNIKLEVSTIINGKKNLLSLINKTIKSKKSAENIYLPISLPRIEQTTELVFDLYDSHNILNSTFVEELVINSNTSTESNLESMPGFDCQDTDGECLVEYLLRHVTFSANYDTNLKTEIYKNDKGRFFVNIPIKKGQKIGSKVRGLNLNGSGPGKGSTSAGNFSGIYPYFVEKNEVASSIWNELRNAIEFKFNGSNKGFHFKQDGSLQLSTSISDGYINIAPGTSTKAPIVFSQGELLTNPVDGALEYDGSDLYFTKGGVRNILGAGSGSPGPAGPAGAQGPAGPPGSGSGIDLSNGGFLNGNISFVGSSFIQDAVFNGSFQFKTAAQNGYVLTSDANGNASWKAPSSGGSNGDITSIGDCLTGACNNFTLTAASAGTIPLKLRGTNNQTANLYQIEDINGTFLFGIQRTGIPYTSISTTAYGYNISGIGVSSIAFGNNISTLGASAIAIGHSSSSSGNGIAIGHSAGNGHGDSIAIGNSTSTTGTNQVAIGRAASVTFSAGAGGGIAIGRSSTTQGGGIAIGHGSSALRDEFVAGSNNISINDVYFGKGKSNVSPTNYSIHGTGGSGTDIDGGSLTLAGGLSTGTGSGGDIIFQTANGGLTSAIANNLHERMRITNIGNIGIGFSTPVATLDVNGSVFSTGLRLRDGTQATGRVLTSDANGLASWQATGGGDITSVGDCLTGACNNFTLTAASAGTIPLSVRAAAGQTANLTEWQISGGSVSTAIREYYGLFNYSGATVSSAIGTSGGGTGFIGANTSYGLAIVDSQAGGWAPDLRGISGNLDSSPTLIFAAGGGAPHFGANTTDNLKINKQRIVRTARDADYAATPLYFTGQHAFSSATTNLSGGNIVISSGNGASASAGNAHGGNLYLNPGRGFGTGQHGSIILARNLGKVGIGFESPSAKLSVNGNIQIADGTQSLGRILTSDANGLASWQAPAGSSQWTDNGTTLYPNEISDSIAIGGTTSAAPIFMDASTGTINATTEFNAGTAATYTEYSVQRIWSGNSSYQISNNVNDRLWMKQWNANYGDYIPGFDAEDKFVFAIDWNNNSANVGEFVVTRNISTVTFNGDANDTLFIIKENGDVGIGTYNPSSTLHVNGSVMIKDGTQAAGRVLTSDANGLASWQVNSAASASGAAGAIQFSDGSSGFTSNGSKFFWNDTNGRLGIGTSTPAASLQIDSDTPLRLNTAAGNTLLNIVTAGTGAATWNFYRPSSPFPGNLGGSITLGTGTLSIGGASSTILVNPVSVSSNSLRGADNLGLSPATFQIRAGDNSVRLMNGNNIAVQGGNVTTAGTWNGGKVYIYGGAGTGGGSTGTISLGINGSGASVSNVGIGFLNPTTKLSINGSVLIKDGTQAAGRVLTSDANGLASWQAPSGGSSEWTDNGTILYPNEIGDDIAIGGTNSSAPIFASSSTGYLNAVRFRISSDAANRYIDGSGFYTNLTNTIRGSDVRLTPTTTGNTFVIIDDETVGGVANSLAIKPAIGKNLTLRGYNSDGIADRLPGAIYLQGGNAHDNNVVNIHGGGLYFEGGAGASDDNSNGGNLYFDGGLGYNSGTHGNIIFSNTRGNVGIGTSTPQRKLHISEAMRLEPQTSPPASASMGDLYVDDSGALCFYDGVSWSVAAGAGACS